MLSALIHKVAILIALFSKSIDSDPFEIIAALSSWTFSNEISALGL